MSGMGVSGVQPRLSSKESRVLELSSFFGFPVHPFNAERLNSPRCHIWGAACFRVSHAISFAWMRRAVCQRQLSFLYCILVIMVRIEMYLCDLIRTSQSIDHLEAYFSQGSATTDLKGGGSFNSTFLHRSFLNLTVKKIWKSVHCCRSYKNKSRPLFETRGISADTLAHVWFLITAVDDDADDGIPTVLIIAVCCGVGGVLLIIIIVVIVICAIRRRKRLF